MKTPTIWVTSDTHFTHTNVIGFCNRPFENVSKMGHGLIRKWNERVTPDDTVYHLGDFAFENRSDSALRRVFKELNGVKHLIIGNHDDKRVQRLKWASVSWAQTVELDGVEFYMTHYPIAKMPTTDCSTVYLHGHLHTKGPSTVPRFDVGVDANGYAPVRLADIAAEAKAYQTGLVKLDQMRRAWA